MSLAGKLVPLYNLLIYCFHVYIFSAEARLYGKPKSEERKSRRRERGGGEEERS